MLKLAIVLASLAIATHASASHKGFCPELRGTHGIVYADTLNACVWDYQHPVKRTPHAHAI